MSDSRDLRLPLLFFPLLALIVLSRIEATRDVLARSISVALPLFALARGVAPYRDADGLLRPGAFVVTGVCAAAAETAVGGALADVHWSAPLLHALVATLLAAAAAAIVLEGLQSRHGVRTRLAGWTGIAVAFGLYMPHAYRADNAFGTVLGGFFLALFGGGGVGVLSGAAAVSALRKA